jgi:hypothetical protein
VLIAGGMSLSYGGITSGTVETGDIVGVGSGL